MRFLDWDTNEPPVGAQVVGIHHPRGSHKRISFGDRYVKVWALDTPPDDLFYHVRWTRGILEPGSSGSPLLSSSGKLIGVLSYGYEFSSTEICQQNPFLTGYGRFSVAYPYLKKYLEDPPPSELAVAPGSLEFQLVNGVVTSSERQTLIVSSASRTPVAFTISTDAPWLVLSASGGSVASGSNVMVGVSVRGNLLARAGTYTATVTLKGGGMSQTMTVKAQSTVKASSVVAEVSPNPVPAQAPDADGCRWQFRVSLQEQAGVTTRVAQLRINGQNYSSNMGAWFGSDILPASGRLEGRLRACGSATPGEQLIEFAGVDPGSGERWSQSLTAWFVGP
jgi:hypothetical protein